jgi:hypothetical protein
MSDLPSDRALEASKLILLKFQSMYLESIKGLSAREGQAALMLVGMHCFGTVASYQIGLNGADRKAIFDMCMEQIVKDTDEKLESLKKFPKDENGRPDMERRQRKWES